MLTRSLDRRLFLKTTAAACCLGSGSPLLAADEAAAAGDTMKYKKAVKWGMVQIKGSVLDKFKLLKELGFDGVELDAPGGPPVEEILKAKEETGLEVPGVVDSVHWGKPLSSPDEAVRAAGLKALLEAIDYCHAVGGTSVLLVPGVARGGVSFQEAWDRSIPEIKKAIPKADELQIDILIENVWNDFLVDPENMAKFIDACESPRVGAHFDVGNTIRYSPSHEWVPVLGKRIKKLDIKDFKKGSGPGTGFGAKLLEGDVDWPLVMKELRTIGYFGWGTAEIQGGDRTWLTDVAARMDKIFAS